MKYERAKDYWTNYGDKMIEQIGEWFKNHQGILKNITKSGINLIRSVRIVNLFKANHSFAETIKLEAIFRHYPLEIQSYIYILFTGRKFLNAKSKKEVS